MPESLETQLTRVQQAIAAIEERGQATDVNGRSLTRADLRTLYAREADLRARIANRGRGGRPRVWRIVAR
ncbi:MAG TPA: hypothetical protein VK399_19935 [Longimicrobiaceae bacterium]|nr:hypothetical protein [Longimicrobiaceae bacterium]